MPFPQSPFLRFLAALILAPLAGGAAAFLLSMLVSLIGDRQSLVKAATASSVFGFWAWIIALVYVLVVGTIAFIYARVRHRTLSLKVAIIVGLLTGVVPFIIISVSDWHADIVGAFAFPLLAAVCAVATSWAFWRLAFGPTNFPAAAE